MNTTVYELKQYYVAQGGTAADVENITNIPDMIAAITALGGGSGGGITMISVSYGSTGTPTLDITTEDLIALLKAGDVWVTFGDMRCRLISWTDSDGGDKPYVFISVSTYNGGTFTKWSSANATDKPTM